MTRFKIHNNNNNSYNNNSNHTNNTTSSVPVSLASFLEEEKLKNKEMMEKEKEKEGTNSKSNMQAQVKKIAETFNEENQKYDLVSLISSKDSTLVFENQISL